jgi:hypothetical protein
MLAGPGPAQTQQPPSMLFFQRTIATPRVAAMRKATNHVSPGHARGTAESACDGLRALLFVGNHLLIRKQSMFR